MSHVPSVVSLLLFLSAVAPARAEPTPADAVKAIAPKRFNLQQKDAALSKVLEAFQKETGVGVVLPPGEDPRISLDLTNVSFWPALDAIAKAADMHVYPYFRDGKLSLLRGRRDVPTCYSGPFRITLKRIVVTRDLESDTSTTRATLEIVWPPPFEAFLLKTRPHGLVVQDDKGMNLPLPPAGESYADALGMKAIELEVKLPSVPRSVPRLGLVKGNVVFVGAAKMLTFSFEGEQLMPGKPQVKDGVTVDLSEVKTMKDPWLIQCRTKYPPGGPQFESHLRQSCLRGNQAFLVKGDLRLRPKGTETVEAPENESMIRYRFGDDEDGKQLKEPSKWRLEYRTPSPLLEIAIPFEFSEVALP